MFLSATTFWILTATSAPAQPKATRAPKTLRGLQATSEAAREPHRKGPLKRPCQGQPTALSPGPRDRKEWIDLTSLRQHTTQETC